MVDSAILDTRTARLSAMPLDASNVTMNIIQGTSQYYWTDFFVTGNIISWLGKPLELLLDSGDKIRVVYEGDPNPSYPSPKPI